MDNTSRTISTPTDADNNNSDNLPLPIADRAASGLSASKVVKSEILGVPIGAVIELGAASKTLACFLQATFLSRDKRSTFRRRQLIADLGCMSVHTLRNQSAALDGMHIERVQRERGRRSTTVYLTDSATGERVSHKQAWQRWKGDKMYVPIPLYALKTLGSWNQQLVYGYMLYRAAMSESDCHCDETGRQIGRYLCLARSSVDLALSGLSERGWIQREVDGTFTLLAADDLRGIGSSVAQNQPTTCPDPARLKEANSVKETLISKPQQPGDHLQISSHDSSGSTAFTATPRRLTPKTTVGLEDATEAYVYLRKQLCLGRHSHPDDAPVTQLWLVAVLFTAKLISSHEFRDSIEAFKRTTVPVRMPVRYYFACMLELLTKRKARWTRLLRRVDVPEMPAHLQPRDVHKKEVSQDRSRQPAMVGSDVRVGELQSALGARSGLSPEEAAAIAELDAMVRHRQEQDRLGL